MKISLLSIAFIGAIFVHAQVEIDQRIVLSGSDGNRMIEQLETPVNSTDAANKAYVDNAVSASGSPVKTRLSDESPSNLNFGGAMRYCRDLEESGFDDWEMPTLEEVVKVYSRGTYSVPNGMSSNYFWTFALQGANAWDHTHIFRFSDGGITIGPSTSASYRARCVR